MFTHLTVLIAHFISNLFGRQSRTVYVIALIQSTFALNQWNLFLLHRQNSLSFRHRKLLYYDGQNKIKKYIKRTMSLLATSFRLPCMKLLLSMVLTTGSSQSSRESTCFTNSFNLSVRSVRYCPVPCNSFHINPVHFKLNHQYLNQLDSI